MYQKADYYLNELAQKSGGRVLRADSLASLPVAFGEIAVRSVIIRPTGRATAAIERFKCARRARTP
jgi:hypothetical protein